MTRSSPNKDLCFHQDSARRANGPYGRVWRTIALGSRLAVALVFFSSSGRADFEKTETAWDGASQAHAALLEVVPKERLIWNEELSFEALRPEDGVIFVHPENPLDIENWSAFLRAGGRLVTLDDYGTTDALLEHFGMRRIPLPDNPNQTVADRDVFPIAEAFGAHPTVADVDRIVLNHATGIDHPNLSVVLSVHSKGSDVAVAVAGAVKQGRLFAFGDSSIFINEMLVYEGNRKFLKNLAHYALEDDSWGHRKGRLFVLCGRAKTSGRFSGAKDAGLFGDLFARLRDEWQTIQEKGFPDSFWIASALFSTAACVFWVYARAALSYRFRRPRYIRPVPLAMQGGIAGRIAFLRSNPQLRATSLLDYRFAIEAAIRRKFGMQDKAFGLRDLFLRCQDVYPAETAKELRRFFHVCARTETALLARTSLGMDNKSFESWAKRGEQLLAELDRPLSEAAAANANLRKDHAEPGLSELRSPPWK